MDRDTQVVERMRSDIARVIALKHAITVTTAWLFAWGTVIVILRVALGIESGLHWWIVGGGACLVVMLIAAAVIARNQTPGAAVLRAFLDGQNRIGGLAMAEQETNIGQWRDRMPAMVPARVGLRGKKLWVLPLLGVVFVAAGFLVPARMIDTLRPPRLDTTSQERKLEHQIQVLEKERMLDPVEAKVLREKLEQITGDAAGNDPAKTLEALDHLSKTLAQKAEAAASAELQKMEKLAAMQAAAEELATPDIDLSPKDLTEAMAEVGRRVEKMDAERGLVEKLPAELAAATAKGTLTKEQMKELAKLLKKNEAEIAEGLKQLADAGLLDAGAVKKAENMGQNAAEAAKELSEFLKNAGDGIPMEQRLDEWGKCAGGVCDGEGDGEITRGGGRAPLDLSNKANDDGTAFTPETLPPAQLEALKKSRLVGTSAAAPTLTKEDGASSGGQLGNAASGGGSASKHAVLPRHQGVVKRYFDREQKQ